MEHKTSRLKYPPYHSEDEQFLKTARLMTAEIRQQPQPRPAAFRRHGKMLITTQGEHTTYAKRIDDAEGCEDCNIEHKRKQNEYRLCNQRPSHYRTACICMSSSIIALPK